MAFFNWLKRGKKNNDSVKVTKVKEDSVEHGSMASGNPTAAAKTLHRMMEQKSAPTKILVVEDGTYSRAMTDYAIKMAQRLDCEIVALDVSESPLRYSGERREQEITRFYDRAEQNVSNFVSEAKENGVQVTHLMKIGETEQVIGELSAQDPGIRYVLTEPEPELVDTSEGRVQIPVFDLACSRL